MLPVGPILLTILLVLIATGWLDRPLARMGVTVRRALLAVGAMLLLSAVELDLAPGLSINVGGGVLPLGLCTYLLVTGDDWMESARTAGAVVVTAASVYLVGRFFPPGLPTELNLFWLDAQYLYGFVGGLVGVTAGRSRRAAFCAAVTGVMLADLVHYLRYGLDDARPVGHVTMGGSGFWDTALVAGLLATVLAEWVREPRETAALRREGQ
jgi:uncharacterized membrane protein